jgi:hypothetical protein
MISVELGPRSRALIEEIGGNILAAIDDATKAMTHLGTSIAGVATGVTALAAAVRTAATNPNEANWETIAVALESQATVLDGLGKTITDTLAAIPPAPVVPVTP